ncbi:pentatricopeptide repeat-containing protein At4g08210 [Aristolochia californica]|uniref:pentatricopeptide repeat-containing protein At4g08210 n=1 Tax=Aristolochia californica TaxID=171875 RepID=UPI0035DD28DD
MKKCSFLLLAPRSNGVLQALYACRQKQSLSYAKSLHCQLVTLGFVKDVFIANNLIAIYSDHKTPDDAQHVFDNMPERNVVSWTALISAYTRSGNHQDSLSLFLNMLEVKQEVPNNVTFSVALKACAMSQNLEVGKLIHNCILGTRLQLDAVLMNSLLDMYVKCGSLLNAREVFDCIYPKSLISWNIIIDGYSKIGQMEDALFLFSQMPKRDTVTWNSIIAGFAHKDGAQALAFLSIMHKEGCEFDEFTFPCALKACSVTAAVTMGKQVHCYMVKSGFLLGCFCGSALVDVYSKCGEINEAVKMFDEHEAAESLGLGRIGLWNSVISGYVCNDHNSTALVMVSRAHKLGLVFDSYTFGSVLKACTQNLNFGRQVHGLIITSGHHLDSVVGSGLTGMYAKCGKIEKALKIFSGIPVKDLVAWGGLITGCAQEGFSKLALSLFKDMVHLKLQVDEFVVSSVLKVCSNLTGLECGKQIHAYSVKNGYVLDSVTVTSLIDMYSKCGSIDDGIKLFEGTNVRDTICWTGIIVGCGQNGRADEAMHFFIEMLRSGISPNEITILGILSACRHAGLVEDARGLFWSMRTEYGLVPQLEHYCCMVDILGRAGLFEEVEKLINEMPYEPNETIWRSLLVACDTHNNLLLGKCAANRLVAICPNDVSAFVTLSNIFARLGMWTESTKLRDVAREVGLKESGRSWIGFIK